MHILAKIFSIWSACQILGCEATIPHLPDIYFPDRPWHNCAPYQKWQRAIEEAGDFLGRGHRLMSEATQAIYPLVDPERLSLLVPLIEDPAVRQKIILRAQRENVFAVARLNQAETLAVKASWSNLATADRCFLLAQVIIAELRQKWQWWRYFPYLPDWSYFPDLAGSLQDLPTVGEIALQRSAIHDLMTICRQLAATNPLITPPYDFDEDVIEGRQKEKPWTNSNSYQ